MKIKPCADCGKIPEVEKIFRMKTVHECPCQKIYGRYYTIKAWNEKQDQMENEETIWDNLGNDHDGCGGYKEEK